MKKDFKKILLFLKRKAPVYILSMLLSCAIVSVCYNIVLAVIMNRVLNAIQFRTASYLWDAVWIAIISFSIAFLMEPVFNQIKNRCVRETMSWIRQKVFEHLELTTVEAFESESHGDILTKLNKDIARLEDIYLKYLPNLCFAIIHGGIAIVLMIYYNVILASLALLLGILSVLVNLVISKQMEKFSGRRQKSYGIMTQKLMDVMDGFVDIKMMAGEEYFMKKFQATSRHIMKSEIGNERAKTLLYSSNDLFGNINDIGIMALGLFMALKGYTTIGIVVAIIRLQGNASYLFQNFSEFLSGLYEALPSAHRVMEILELPMERNGGDLENEIENAKRLGEIRINGMDFGYIEGKPLLEHVTLTIKKGGFIGILGESGSGKSTIVKILLGFYQPWRAYAYS